MLFDSLHTKLLKLGDATLVYPAHGAGSLCGKAISQETVSTLGEQRSVNYALQSMTKNAFIEVVTADQPDAPAYFTYDAVLNSQERLTLDQALARGMNPLTLDALLVLQSDGARVLDTREAAEFAQAHLAGSINIGLVGSYATWAGTVLARDHPIVIVADPGFESEAAVRLGPGVTAPIRWRFEPVDAAIRLRKASDEMDLVLAAHGVSERTRFAARLVAEEIVRNAFEHGGAKVVTMDVDPAGDPHRLVLEDDGVPFDVAAPRGPDATLNLGSRGRGLILVRAMTRSVEHSSAGGRNRLSILLVER